MKPTVWDFLQFTCVPRGNYSLIIPFKAVVDINNLVGDYLHLAYMREIANG